MNKRIAKKVIKATIAIKCEGNFIRSRHNRKQMAAAICRLNQLLNRFGIEACRNLLPAMMTTESKRFAK